ncbi:hypothetical protein AOLI_G00008630 [Acnodon oligacanthus]
MTDRGELQLRVSALARFGLNEARMSCRQQPATTPDNTTPPLHPREIHQNGSIRARTLHVRLAACRLHVGKHAERVARARSAAL